MGFFSISTQERHNQNCWYFSFLLFTPKPSQIFEIGWLHSIPHQNALLDYFFRFFRVIPSGPKEFLKNCDTTFFHICQFRLDRADQNWTHPVNPCPKPQLLAILKKFQTQNFYDRKNPEKFSVTDIQKKKKSLRCALLSPTTRSTTRKFPHLTLSQ